MRDVAATRRPDRGVGYPLDEFERQHPPRDSEPGYVEESENVTPQSHAQHLKPRFCFSNEITSGRKIPKNRVLNC